MGVELLVWDLKFGVWGMGLRDEGLGLGDVGRVEGGMRGGSERVSGRLRVSGSGLRFQDSGFRDLEPW